MAEKQTTPDELLNLVSLSLRRYYIDTFQERLAPTLVPGKRVLDVGGTRLLKRGSFNVERYQGSVYYANISTAKSPDVQADAAALPFAPGSFDLVICAEVLEHVPYPPAVIAEAARVLRPGGALMITVPFMVRVHGDPYDYGRYTETWWRENLSRAGFTAIEIERQGGFFSVLVDMVREWLHQKVRQDKPRPRWLRRILERGMVRLKRWALRRDALPGYRDDPFFNSHTTGFGICCRKPDAP